MHEWLATCGHGLHRSSRNSSWNSRNWKDHVRHERKWKREKNRSRTQHVCRHLTHSYTHIRYHLQEPKPTVNFKNCSSVCVPVFLLLTSIYDSHHPLLHHSFTPSSQPISQISPIFDCLLLSWLPSVRRLRLNLLSSTVSPLFFSVTVPSSRLSWLPSAFEQALISSMVCHCILTNTHTHNCCTALFPGATGWVGARSELLDFVVQGKINRGRHTIQLGATHPD